MDSSRLDSNHERNTSFSEVHSRSLANATRDCCVFPRRCGAPVQEFAEHLAADVKQLIEDEDTGAKSFRYVKTGTNHYSLAFTYDQIAATRDVYQDLSAFGWLAPPPDAHRGVLSSPKWRLDRDQFRSLEGGAREEIRCLSFALKRSGPQLFGLAKRRLDV